MQTAVNFLLKYIEPSLTDEQKHFFSIVIERAKDLEKRQIINAANLKKEYRWFGAKLHNNCGEKYFAETYESKGSDVCDYCKGKGKIFHHEFGQFVKCGICGSKGSDELSKDAKNESFATSSQTEISDEEIHKIVEQEYERYPNNIYLYGHSDELRLAYKAGVWDAIKWYREQLKSKGNG